MAVTQSMATITAWDKNGKKCQCDSRQYKALAKKGYMLKDPALEKPEVKLDVKPTTKPAVKPTDKK